MIQFTKMHGLGNDFIVIDAVRQHVTLSAAVIKKLANRHTGIGFDQCLIVEKSAKKGVDFFYRIFNANGEEVAQCGNGARCVARFVTEAGLTEKRIITIATYTTTMQLELNQQENVTVKMEKPCFSPEAIPLNAAKESLLYPLPLTNGSVQSVHALSVGNPHAVLHVQNLVNLDIQILGKDISEHTLFPEQTNVSFMQIIDNQHIQLRVYERGVGETQACGSAAVAAAAVAKVFYQLADSLCVSLPGGDLTVFWPKPYDAIYLTGPATFVYEGKLTANL